MPLEKRPQITESRRRASHQPPGSAAVPAIREQLPGDRKGVPGAHRSGRLRRGGSIRRAVRHTDGLRADLDAAGLNGCSVHAIPSGEQAADVLAAARTLGAGTVIVPYLGRKPGSPRQIPVAGCGQRAESDGGPSRRQPLCASAITTTTSSCRPSWTGSKPWRCWSRSLDDGVLLEVDTLLGGGRRPGRASAAGTPGRPGPLPARQGRPDHQARSHDRAVGAGRMPVAEILAAAPAAEWHIVELDRCATDMLTASSSRGLQWMVEHGLATQAQGSVAP